MLGTDRHCLLTLVARKTGPTWIGKLKARTVGPTTVAAMRLITRPLVERLCLAPALIGVIILVLDLIAKLIAIGVGFALEGLLTQARAELQSKKARVEEILRESAG